MKTKKTELIWSILRHRQAVQLSSTAVVCTTVIAKNIKVKIKNPDNHLLKTCFHVCFSCGPCSSPRKSTAWYQITSCKFKFVWFLLCTSPNVRLTNWQGPSTATNLSGAICQASIQHKQQLSESVSFFFYNCFSTQVSCWPVLHSPDELTLTLTCQATT